MTPQVALLYTPLVLLFHNNQGKVALLYTAPQHNNPGQRDLPTFENIKCCYRLLLLLTSVKHPPGILLSMSDFKILH